MPHPAPAVVLHDVRFTWPDGTPAIEHLAGTFSRARTGLVGANGAGKSTLLRLIAGELTPTSGAIQRLGSVDHLPQHAPLRAGTVGDLLGLGPVRRALRAIERGSTNPRDFDAVEGCWDVEERAAAQLAALALPDDLDRPASALSGGEAMLAAIVGLAVRGADIALLDEPTNNLDGDSRQRLSQLVLAWRGTLIVVSHDVALLELMTETAELREGRLRTFGGGFGAYREALAAEQEAARRAVRTAEQVLRREQRERIKAEERIAHSERQGRKDRVQRKFVAAAINDRRNSAEQSQGARRQALGARVAAAHDAVQRAEAAVRDDDAVRIDLVDPRVPRGRRLAVLPSSDGRSVVLSGPERVALVGANGVGKTTMLRGLLPQLRVRHGYLPQRIELDERATVLELVRAAAPDVPPAEVRNRLARLRIRGVMVDRTVGTLSGGERFRVALARLLLADPPPELLILDEPTNDLDLTTVDELVAALRGYRGGLLVVSHDGPFLARLGLTRAVRLLADGRLAEDVLPLAG